MTSWRFLNDFVEILSVHAIWSFIHSSLQVNWRLNIMECTKATHSLVYIVKIGEEGGPITHGDRWINIVKYSVLRHTIVTSWMQIEEMHNLMELIA